MADRGPGGDSRHSCRRGLLRLYAVDRGRVHGPGEDQRLVAVRRGDFVNEVSVSGSLEYKDRDSLSFGTAGTVAEVAVEAGQRIPSGFVLARLDSETIAELERAAVQAEGKLRDAEDALDEARNPYSDVDLARAEADLADALVAKKAAEDALVELQAADPQAIARARTAFPTRR